MPLDLTLHALSVEGDLKTGALDQAERNQAWAQEEGTAVCSPAYLGGIFLLFDLRWEFCYY